MASPNRTLPAPAAPMRSSGSRLLDAFGLRRGKSSKRHRRVQNATRRPRLQSLEDRRLLAGFEVRFEVLDGDTNQVVQTLQPADNYVLRTLVRDGRPAGQNNGILSAYFTVNFDDALVDFTNQFAIGPDFVRGSPGPAGNATAIGELRPGQIFDIGGLSSTGGGDPAAERLLFSVPFSTTNVVSGTLDLDVAAAVTNNERASFNSPFAAVMTFDVRGDMYPITGGTVVLTGTENLSVIEGGQGASFTVALSRAPTANVELDITPSVAGAVSLSQTTVTFTPTDFGPRTINVAAVEDDVAAGPRTVTLATSNLRSADPIYSGQSVADFNVTVTDNDVAAVRFTPTSGLAVDESGATTVVQVRLETRPTAPVTLTFASSDSGEGTVTPATLTFTPENFAVAQPLTIRGVDDDLVDGNQTFQITTSIASSDSVYRSLSVPPLSVVNTDLDVPRVLVMPNRGLRTTEGGGTDMVNVALSTRPTNPVTLTIASSNTAEGTVEPVTLVFGPENFSVPRPVVVRGVDDNAVDGDVAYTVTIAVAAGSDADYASLPPVVLNAVNADQGDAVGVTIDSDGLTTTESGGTDTFRVRLNSRPAAEVVITLASSDSGEATVSPTTLRFSATNFDNFQTVTVTGVNDADADGDQPFQINATVTSADSNYDALAVPPVTGVNQNVAVPVPRLIVSPNVGIQTRENGPASVVNVSLATAPASDVTLSITTSDPTEATAAPTVLTFTPANFAMMQEVTVLGVDDNVVDGDVAYTVTIAVAAGSDPAYAALAPVVVSAVNRDDDTPGLVVTGPDVNFTTESGGAAVVGVQLSRQPLSPVDVTITTGDATEGTPQTATLQFTPTSWNVVQNVSIVGVDDAVVDGDVAYQINVAVTGGDPAFATATAQTVSLTNRDDDVVGVILGDTDNLQTNESGVTDTFTVRLRSRPTAAVRVAPASGDVGEVAVAPAVLTFTPENWQSPQTVTLTGVDDAVVDGPVTTTVSLGFSGSDDAAYAGLIVSPVSVVNADNDTPGVTLSRTDGLRVNEDGSRDDAVVDTFTVRLATPPTAPVTITVATDAPGTATATPQVLTFTADNFDQIQTVTVAGVDEMIDDGDTPFAVRLTASSADAVYDGLPIGSVTGLAIDDDESGIQVVGDDLQVDETGTTATFSVVLTTQPTGTVTIPITSGDAGEVSVPTEPLIFTTDNWSIAQLVTVTGIADGVVDGDVAVTLSVGPASSEDAAFSGVVGQNVVVTNSNVDTSRIIVETAPVTEGFDSLVRLTARLETAVAGTVSVDYATTDGTAMAGADYNAVAGTWAFTGSTAQRINLDVAVLDDAIVELAETFNLMLSGLTTMGIDAADIVLPTAEQLTATILDTDTATITLQPPAVTVDEGDAGDSTDVPISVVLSAPVDGGVQIGFATADGTATAGSDYTAASGTLTFDGDASTQSVPITVLGDTAAEGSEAFRVSLSGLVVPAGLADRVTILNDTSEITIADDDVPRLLIRDVTADRNEGDEGTTTTFTFEVELTDTLVGDPDGFTIDYMTADGTATAGADFQPTSGTLTFAGAADTQTFTVTVLGDAVIEGNEEFFVELVNPVGLSPDAVLQIEPSRIAVVIADDDRTTLSLSADQTTITEGDTGTTTDVVITATLTEAIPGGFTVPFVVAAGTATATGGDYTAPAAGMLTFAGTAGETQTITVTINGDVVVEGDQTLTILIGQIAGLPDRVLGQIDRPADSVTLTIADDDTATLTLSEPVSVAEGSAAAGGQASFTVTLSGQLESGFTLPVTVGGGTATAGVDYAAPATELVFAGTAGEVQTINVSILGDAIVENDEIFAVALNVPTGLSDALLSRLTIDNGAATGTIINDDTASVTLSGPTTVDEPGGTGGSVVVTYTATLTAAVDGGLSVGYQTTGGTAMVGMDFGAANGTLTFDGSAGQTRTFDVTILGDGTFESGETLTIGLTPPTGLSPTIAAAITLPALPVTLTISDDDSATIGFANATSVVAETARTHTIDVVLRTAGGAVLSDPLVLAVVAESGGTAVAADFTIDTPAVTFPAGSRDGAVATVRLTLAQDNLLEPTETVVLGLQITSGDAAGAITAIGGNHTVSITDDPGDAVIAGQIFVDSNNSGVRDSDEIAMAGVTVTLTGVNAIGENVNRQTTTDSAGRYRFTDLVAGDYTVRQTPSADFYEGRGIAGRINGTAAGQSDGTTALTGIRLAPSAVAEGFNFTMLGRRAGSITPYSFTARQPAVRGVNAIGAGINAIGGGLQLSASAVDAVMVRLPTTR